MLPPKSREASPKSIGVEILKAKSRIITPRMKGYCAKFAFWMGDWSVTPAITGNIWKSAANMNESMTPSVSVCVSVMASRLCALKIAVLKRSMSIPESIPKRAPEKKNTKKIF